MSTRKKLDFSMGYSDTDDSLLIGPEYDKYLEENYVPNTEMPKEWITTCAEDHTKH